jgi:hypothetical protein
MTPAIHHGQKTGKRVPVTFRTGAGEIQGDFDTFVDACQRLAPPVLVDPSRR